MSEETLTINDLLQIQKIIDVAVQRGAFKAEETKTVGETYEKITSFLGAIESTEQTDDNVENTEEDSQND